MSAGLLSYPTITSHLSKVSGQFQANSFAHSVRERQVLCQVVCQPNIWHTTPKCCAKWCANTKIGTPLSTSAMSAIPALPLAHHSRRVHAQDRRYWHTTSHKCCATITLCHWHTTPRCHDAPSPPRTPHQTPRRSAGSRASSQARKPLGRPVRGPFLSLPTRPKAGRRT